MKRLAVLLLVTPLLASCGLFMSKSEQFRVMLTDTGHYSNVQVVNDMDDADACAKRDQKNPRKCLEKKKGTKHVGFDSFNNISGDCVVELETDLKVRTWKVDAVNGFDVDWGGSPDWSATMRHISDHNRLNTDNQMCTPFPADLKKVA